MLISVTGFSLMQLSVKFLTHLPFTELVLFRSIISLILSVFIMWQARIPLFGNNRRVLFLRGFFGVIALSLYFFTLQKLPISTAAILQYLSPIFTAIFGIWILKESVKKYQWFFFAVSFSGVAVIKGFNPQLELQYLLAGLGSAIFAGLAYNCIRILRKTERPVVVVFYFPLVATPIMLVTTLFFWVQPQGIDWFWILLMGVFTQVGQLYMTKALQADVASKIASFKYLGIIYAIGFDLFIFGESLYWHTILGITLVLIGVLSNVSLKGRFNKL